MNRLGRSAIRLHARFSPRRFLSAAPEPTAIPDDALVRLICAPQAPNPDLNTAGKSLQELRALLELGNLPPHVAKIARKKIRKKERIELAKAAGNVPEKPKPKPEKTSQAKVPRKESVKARPPHKSKVDPKSPSFVTGWGKDELAPSSFPEDPSIFEIEKQKWKDEHSKGKPKSEKPPFEETVSPLMFDRRIEGVLRPDQIPSVLQDVEPPSPQLPVAELEHKLDRVLFNPGVHWLQDSRSRVYNFDPYLQDIPPVTDFAFERLPGFVPSSADTDITTLLQTHDKKFSGSTSSLSGILSHIYFLMCGDRLVDLGTLSREMQGEKRTFTPGQRMAASVVFNHKDGRYMIDTSADKNDHASKNILLWLGTLLEKFLTMPKDKFAAYRRSVTDVPLPEKSTMREAFRFSKSQKFIMRSQLDCYDPRLPGTGVFDIKTRACVSIRLDLFNFEENSGYLIRKQHGRYESFEREYYDLIRSAFLKYQFQARIGNMDGVIVAYHNTKQMFGFQYVPLEELDERLFGPGEGLGDRIFKGCVGIMENLAEEIVGCFPGQSVKATIEKLEFSNILNVWVEPVEWDETEKGARPIRQIQARTWSYLDSQITKPWEAYREMDKEWSVRWQIAHLIASEAEMRHGLMEAEKRRWRAWAAPSGVDPEDLKEWYESLNFGGSQDGKEKAFDPEMFSENVDSALARFRRLARQGRMDSERIRELEEGKPQHVLGATYEEQELGSDSRDNVEPGSEMIREREEGEPQDVLGETYEEQGLGNDSRDNVEPGGESPESRVENTSI